MSATQTCLIIDSDSVGEELFQKAVEASDTVIEWTYVTSCREAIKYILNKHTAAPDFVFFEWYMPGIDGIDCLLTLRQYNKLAQARFVIYGGENREEMYQLSVRYDCLLLPKSESVSEMSRILNSIFYLKSAQEL
jgi:CheY-like chemotaxis protein